MKLYLADLHISSILDQRCKKQQICQIYLCYFLKGGANFLDHGQIGTVSFAIQLCAIRTVLLVE